MIHSKIVSSTMVVKSQQIQSAIKLIYIINLDNLCQWFMKFFLNSVFVFYLFPIFLTNFLQSVLPNINLEQFWY